MGAVGRAAQKVIPREELVMLIRRIMDMPPAKKVVGPRITPAEALILDTLCETPHLSRTELRDITGLSCTPELGRLAKRSLIANRFVRKHNTVLWWVTDAGKEAARAPQEWAIYPERGVRANG